MCIRDRFLSPYTNKRTDEYGGGFAQRMRFPMEIVQGIKESLGRDFPISFRFSADEFVHGGIDVSEAQRMAQAMEKAGVDALHVSAGIYESLPTLLEPMSYAQGWRCHLAAEIKKAVTVPVIAVGVIREPAFAETCSGRAVINSCLWNNRRSPSPSSWQARTGSCRQILPAHSSGPSSSRSPVS